MKVFYILILFAVGLIGINFLRLKDVMGPEISGIQELISLKGISLGAMQLFAVFFAIAATSLLIPRDMEDRTLYTILCKPVPRIDYLIGKWLGVMLLIGTCLALMDLALTVNLYLRTDTVLVEQTEHLNTMGFSEASRANFLEKIRDQGATGSFQFAILAIWMEAGVMAAVALFISTLSTSTLFSLIASFSVYAIGLFQADARAFVLKGDSSWLQNFTARGIAYLFPDLQFYGVVDAVSRGESVVALQAWNLSGISAIYVGIYLVLAWFIFSRKEF